MRAIALMLATGAIAIIGCRLASHAPNPQWLADFQRANAIVVTTEKVRHAISDPQAIERLRDVYANAEWRPYRATVPALQGPRIDLLEGETTLRRFDYDRTGRLWESGSYTDIRTAELSDADKQFIESLFSQVPDGPQSPKAVE